MSHSVLKALEQLLCNFDNVSSSFGNNARIWMAMKRIFLHVPCSDDVKECHWPACLREHVRS